MLWCLGFRVNKIFPQSNQSNQLEELKSILRKSFQDVRGEMDEHLFSINQNTSEIQGSQTSIAELDAKVEKLSERLDELFMMLAPEKGLDVSSIKLTRQEQEVFLVLYASENPLTPAQVGAKIGLGRQLAAQYLYNLQLKGVPMLARNWNGELFYALELKFKDLQARKNVLRIPLDVQRRVASIL